MEFKFVQISIIIPTYNESDNILILIDKIFEIFIKYELKGEVIVVDDNSPDNTWKIVNQLTNLYQNLKLIHRINKRGLSSAVVEGIQISTGEIVGVMDADLSHPPEKIPELLEPIISGDSNFVMGSRYIKGGEIDKWEFKRKIYSRLATLSARGLTNIKDPMSGYFFFKKDVIKNIKLNPRGFKIGLEILIKGKFQRTKEVPFKFYKRHSGESKVTLQIIIQSLIHILKLYVYKYKIRI